MTDTYKVRMMVLAVLHADDPEEAKQSALEMAADAGLAVLHTEEPEKVASPPQFRDQGDIYP